MPLWRYAGLLWRQLWLAMLLALQYRLDFVLNSVLALVWTGVGLVPLLVLFAQRSEIAGWTWPRALIVVGWFTVLRGVLDGAIRPSLQDVVERIRAGTLDFVLLKPADAQFLVSTTRFQLWNAVDVLSGLLIVGAGLVRSHHVPSPAAVLLCVVLLFSATLLLYSFWILIVGLAFVAVKVDNLSYLFASIYEAARWPASVFRGVLAFIFTFVIPLALMTTYPALAILDALPRSRALGALLGALAFALLARHVWKRSIRLYTSAGG